MQDCFRQHPEMYGSELEDEEDEIEEEILAQENAKASSEESTKPTFESAPEPSKDALSPPAQEKAAAPNTSDGENQDTAAAETRKTGHESGDLVPKASYDATSK
jgi:mitochondrial intermembrane space import and assembly protein 40